MRPVAPEKSANQGARRGVWSFQMNDEQRGVALFQAQPAGLGLFLRPAVLSFAHVAGLHHAHSALLGTKTATADVLD